MRTTAIILLALLPTAGLAQSEGLKLGVKVIPQSTWMLNQQDSDAGPEFDYVTTWGLAFGASGDIFTSPNFGVGLEMLYSSQGQKFKAFDTLQFAKKLTYLKVPLLLNFATAGDGTNFLAQVGPQMNILLNSDLQDENGHPVPNTIAYKSVSFAVALFLGVTINVGVAAIVTGLRFDYGLTDAEDKDASIGLSPDRGVLKTATGGPVLGVRLGLGG